MIRIEKNGKTKHGGHDRNNDDFMIYIWTIYQSGYRHLDITHIEHFKQTIDDLYSTFLKLMQQGIKLFVEQYPHYKNNVQIIDTSNIANGHFNKLYTLDGLHFRPMSLKSSIVQHNVVSDMIANIWLNHLCVE